MGTNYQSVNLIAHSEPNQELQDQGVNTLLDFIAYTARVSNPSAQIKESAGLVKYLVNHKHWSPFEMASITLEINTTRDIARQILRHRSFSFQEFSQRYADPTKDMTFVKREARLQDTKNRQNSFDTDNDQLEAYWQASQDNVTEEALKAYAWAVDPENMIAKEQARAVLPEGLTMTRMYMAGSVRSWMHYIDLRSSHGTQKEHMEVARMAADAIEPVFPMISAFVGGFKSPAQLDVIQYLTARADLGDNIAADLLRSM
jgi:thymidylate synthase (FAD)